jgi:hypothetical protein
MECQSVEAVQNEKFETWAIVEIMGRQRYAGLVTEQTLAGAAMLRVDIPETKKQGAFTKLFGSSSIHSLTPTTEAIARALAERLDQAPVQVYDLPQLAEQRRRLLGQLNDVDELDDDDDEVIRTDSDVDDDDEW